jgi:hypothetical protein
MTKTCPIPTCRTTPDKCVRLDCPFRQPAKTKPEVELVDHRKPVILKGVKL